MLDSFDQGLKQHKLDLWIIKNNNRVNSRVKIKQISLSEIQEMYSQHTKAKRMSERNSDNKRDSKSDIKSNSKRNSKRDIKSDSKRDSKHTIKMEISSDLNKINRGILNNLKHNQSSVNKCTSFNTSIDIDSDNDDSDNEPLI